MVLFTYFYIFHTLFIQMYVATFQQHVHMEYSLYIYISQLIQCSRACVSYHDFLDRGFALRRKLLNQGFLAIVAKFYCATDETKNMSMQSMFCLYQISFPLKVSLLHLSRQKYIFQFVSYFTCWLRFYTCSYCADIFLIYGLVR